MREEVEETTADRAADLQLGGMALRDGVLLQSPRTGRRPCATTPAASR